MCFIKTSVCSSRVSETKTNVCARTIVSPSWFAKRSILVFGIPCNENMLLQAVPGVVSQKSFKLDSCFYVRGYITFIRERVTKPFSKY